jgi:4-hydroxy-tetrahydrodipicolinate reductase
MGQAVAGVAGSDRRFAVAGGVCRRPKGTPFVSPAAADSALKTADVVVDFSLPAGTLALARKAARAKVPFVTGTTGMSGPQRAELRRLSRKVAVLAAPNMSPGMNLLFALSKKAAAALADYDAGVFEIHHTLKKDAPSGSAVRLAEAVREGRGRGPVPAESLRLGRVVGEHTVHFANPYERLELTHRAQDRSVFARGALLAAAWLWKKRRRPGLYTMEDALGLR